MHYSKELAISAKNVIKAELSLTLVCLFITALITKNSNAILSSLIGCFMVVAPTIVYAKIAFARGLIVLPEVALKQHKRAVMVRFVMNIVLFALVFVFYRSLNLLAFFMTYIVVISGYWLSLVMKTK